jgi:hypothetical protein
MNILDLINEAQFKANQYQQSFSVILSGTRLEVMQTDRALQWGREILETCTFVDLG